MCDVPHGSILGPLLLKNFIHDCDDRTLSILSKVTNYTKLGEMAEKLQGRATIQKDRRNGPQEVQQRQTQCPVLGAGDVNAG